MKRRAAARASAKSNGASMSVDKYFAAVPEAARAALEKMRGTIRSTLPRDAMETISYRIPAFKHNDQVLVWYAAFSKHCSLFPGASVIEALKDELNEWVTSKGTVQFPNDKPLPVALIKKLVKARIAETGRKRR